MTDKSLTKKLLGWAFVNEDDEAEASARPEEIVAKYKKQAEQAAPPPPQPLVELKGAPTPVASDGTVDFRRVYASADIGADAQERIERALTLIASLPTEAPVAVKKQIVEASLKAFGFPIDRLIESAAQQMQALDSYIRMGQRTTQETLTAGNARIEQLTRQIAEEKTKMEAQVAQQQALMRTTNTEKLRIQPVIEFFGHDAVLRVVQESPRLVETKKE